MFSGSFVAIVTPMRPDGSIDYDAWSRLIDLHLASGTRGIIVAGTTGESPSVDDGEVDRIGARRLRQGAQLVAAALGAHARPVPPRRSMTRSGCSSRWTSASC